MSKKKITIIITAAALAVIIIVIALVSCSQKNKQSAVTSETSSVVETTSGTSTENSTSGTSQTTSKATTSTSASSSGETSVSDNTTEENTTTQQTETDPASDTSSSTEQITNNDNKSHTADPYSESCDCPYCSGNVSYRSARTVHHDAVTHEEIDVNYDKIVRTYQYTIVWSDNIRNYCADNGIDLPSPPSASGSVVFDADWNTLDDSGEDNALDSIFDEASDIASDVGFSGAAFGYTSEVIDDEYEGRHENTTTVVDEEAWDENIPAGWYCDSCDYYSSSIPNEYEI